jgi:hypothetical protein
MKIMKCKLTVLPLVVLSLAAKFCLANISITKSQFSSSAESKEVFKNKVQRVGKSDLAFEDNASFIENPSDSCESSRLGYIMLDQVVNSGQLVYKWMEKENGEFQNKYVRPAFRRLEFVYSKDEVVFGLRKYKYTLTFEGNGVQLGNVENQKYIDLFSYLKTRIETDQSDINVQSILVLLQDLKSLCPNENSYLSIRTFGKQGEESKSEDKLFTINIHFLNLSYPNILSVYKISMNSQSWIDLLSSVD